MFKAGSSRASMSSRLSMDEVQNIVENLKHKQHRDMTKRNYYVIWKIFNQFLIHLDRRPVTWEDRLTLFVGYLFHNNRQSFTVHSYISAIKTTLKSNNIDISEDQLLLASLTRACKLKNDCVRTRLPIQKGMLSVILRRTQRYYAEHDQPYLSVLYSAMISTMYFGLFHISEVTSGTHPVLAKDVHIGANKKKFLFVLQMSKMHTKSAEPQMIKVSSKTLHYKICCLVSDLPCPYELLNKYSGYRGGLRSDTEPFFVLPDKSPVTPRHLSLCLKNIIRLSGFDETVYGSHSLRIGRTCDLFKLGLSVETIKKLGCWRSNAVFRYLKN